MHKQETIGKNTPVSISINTPHLSSQKTTDRSRMRQILSIFHSLNREHFNSSIPAPSFRLSRRMTTSAGSVLYSENRHTVTISIPYHNHFGWKEELVSTLKHEMIHLYLEQTQGIRGHGSEFLKYCKIIGTERYCKSRPERKSVYYYTCPNCHEEYKYKRKVKLYCGICNRKKNFVNRRLRLIRVVHPSVETSEVNQSSSDLKILAQQTKQLHLPGLEEFLSKRPGEQRTKRIISNTSLASAQEARKNVMSHEQKTS